VLRLVTALDLALLTIPERIADLVEVDPFDNSLFVTQADRVIRLSAPPGSGFAQPVPEPASLTVLGLFALCLAGFATRLPAGQPVHSSS
jgi:hypothetical protein